MRPIKELLELVLSSLTDLKASEIEYDVTSPKLSGLCGFPKCEWFSGTCNGSEFTGDEYDQYLQYIHLNAPSSKEKRANMQVPHRSPVYAPAYWATCEFLYWWQYDDIDSRIKFIQKLINNIENETV